MEGDFDLNSSADTSGQIFINLQPLQLEGLQQSDEEPSVRNPEYSDISDNEFNAVDSIVNDVAGGRLGTTCIFSDEDLLIWPQSILLEFGYSATQIRKRPKSEPEFWVRNIAKTRRQKGLSYKTYRGSGPKSETKPPKTPVNCSCKCRYKCHENFSEDARLTICQSFYALSDENRKRDFICKSVDEHDVKRCRSAAGNRREVSYSYYFETQSTRKRVCLEFFMKTLAVSRKFIRSTLARRSLAATYCGSDRRGRHIPANKISDEKLSIVRQHIASYPAVESHYCRKKSSRLYLPADLSLKIMYDEYRKVDQTSPVSLSKYRQVFVNNFNIAFHVPKKDQCSICTKYSNSKGKMDADLEFSYQEHLRLKARAQDEKLSDKLRAQNDPNFQSITFDLESVLYLPSSNVSTMFYKRKLSVYNLTCYYQTFPHDAYCFVWPETEGHRGAIEIASSVCKFLSMVPSTVNEISMFSDSCAGQNRNQFVAVTLLWASRAYHLKIINHKFLESGHSYMECDSMHSAIERAKKNRMVFAIEDWLNIILSARRANPYKIYRLSHLDFHDFKHLAEQLLTKKITDINGSKVNWRLVKWFQFRKDFPDSIFFKYNYDDHNFLEISCKNQTEKRKSYQYSSCKLVKAYSGLLPISTKKYNDLLSLCKSGAIPENYRFFYESLPHSGEIVDKLEEADILDDDEFEFEF